MHSFTMDHSGSTCVCVCACVCVCERHTEREREREREKGRESVGRVIFHDRPFKVHQCVLS